MNVDYMELGKRISKRRKELKMTQETLAELTGFSNNHISNIENNHTKASIESILKISVVLKTTPDYFLLGILKPEPSEQDYSIIQKLMLCDEKKKIFLSNFIDWFINENNTYNL